MTTKGNFSYRVGLEGGDAVESGFQRVGRAGEDAHKRIDRGAKSAERSAAVFTRRLAEEERAFRALKASVDPAYAAKQQLERTQRQLNQAMQRGIIDHREHARVMRLAENQMRQNAAAMELMDSSAMRGGNGLRMMSMQLSQVAQQGAATGNYLQALVIQAPDLALGFGAVGIAVGALVPILYGVSQAAFGARKELEAIDIDVQGAYSRVSASVEAAREAQERYTLAIRLQGQYQQQITDETIAALGREARAREALANLDNVRLERQRRAAEAQLAMMRAELAEQIERAVASAPTILPRPGENPFDLNSAERRSLEITREVVRQNEELVFNIREQQATLELVNALLDQTHGEAAAIVDELSRVQSEAAAGAVALLDGAAAGRQLSGSISSIDFRAALAGARSLAAELNISLHRALQIKGLIGAAAQARNDAVIYDPRDPRFDSEAARVGRLREQMSQIPVSTVSPFDLSRMRQDTAPVIGSSGRGGGGGGRARSGGGGGGPSTAALREQNQAMREAEQIYRSTRTEAERYAIEMEKLDELYKSGALADFGGIETYKRATAALKEEYEGAAAGARAFGQITTQTRNAVIDALMGQKDAAEQLKRTIIRLTAEYLLFRTVSGAPVSGGLGGFVTQLGKAVLGGLPSFDGGGHTGYGSRSGGLDGRGGFMALLHHDETVIDHTRGGAAAGGGTTQVVVTLSPDLEARILQQAAGQTVQIAGQIATRQQRALGPTLQSMQERGV